MSPAPGSPFFGLRRDWPLILAVIGGLIITTFVAAMLRAGEQEQRQGEVVRQADDYADAIRERLELTSERMVAVRGLFATVEAVSARQFAAFVQPLLDTRVAVQSLEWLPRVPHASRAAYERESGQVIREPAGGGLVPAAERPEYFPVRYVEPFVSSAPAAGFDVGAEPAPRRVLEIARDRGVLVLSAPLRPVLSRDRDAPVLAALPVYAADLPTDGEEQRRTALRGFILGVLRVEPLFQFALAGKPDEGYDIVLRDPDARSGNDTLAVRLGPGRDVAGVMAAADRVVRSLNFGEQNWELVVAPRPGTASGAAVPSSWLALGLGLAATLAVVWIVRFLLAGQEQAAGQAARRSADLQRSELALGESRERLQLALSGARMWAWDWDIAADRLDWTSSPEELLGPEPPGGYGDFRTLVLEEDRQTFLAAGRAALETGAHYACEFRIRRSDGRIAWVWASGVAVRGPDGRAQRMIGVSQDCTGRHETAERMEFQRSLLESLIEASVDGILVVSPDRRWIVWNRNFIQIWGIPPEVLSERSSPSLVRYSLPLLVDPDGFEREIETIYARPDYRGRSEVRLKDGRVFDRHTAPIVGAGGTLLGRCWFYHDITERIRFEDQLGRARDAAEHASRAKSAFLATMSHEIRTPMNGVLGMAELLRMSELSDEQADYVRTLTDSGNALMRILNDILDFSKIEAGHLDIAETPFDPAALVRDVCALMAPRAKEKGLAIGVGLDDGMPSLRGDVNRLRQVLVNLVGNAIKFTEHGTVSVSAACTVGAGTTATLSVGVRDTGIGIAPDAMNRLFQPFVQADASTTRRFGGTGLGLAISRRLMEAMGGSITARSEIGQGAEFRFEIALPFAEQVAGPVAANPLDSRNLQGRRVLLAEDNDVNAIVTKEMLRRHGVTVTRVVNGREAVSACRGGPFDAILMDVRMPELDGIAATREIRALEGPHIPIVALTANAMPDDRAVCLAAGMDDFIAKPFTDRTLVAVLLDAIGASAAAPVAQVFDLAALRAVTDAAGILPLDLIDVFVEESAGLLGRMRVAAQDGQRESLQRDAHSLKSSAANVGARRLAAAAGQLERDCAQAVPAGADTRIAALEAEFAAYRAMVAENSPELSES